VRNLSRTKYNPISDETKLREEINQLDKWANSNLLKIEDLYIEDLYFMSVIDKSIKLIDTFLYAMEKRNITVLATLTRVQIDCVCRTYASTMVSDADKFCEEVLLKDTPINKLVDKDGKKLTDKHLCEAVGEFLQLPVYDLYQKVCGFVHFSSSSFHNIVRAHEKYDITMLIGRQNMPGDEETYTRLTMELANQFLFFGVVLIHDLLGGWLVQKEREKAEHEKLNQ
jgi:hypothetical protein